MGAQRQAMVAVIKNFDPIMIDCPSSLEEQNQVNHDSLRYRGNN